MLKSNNANLNQTIYGNVKSIIDMLTNFTLSPYTSAENIASYIPPLYPDLDWVIVTVDSNSTSNDTAIECGLNCL